MNKKFISSLLSIMLVMGISPICASAEWKQNSDNSWSWLEDGFMHYNGWKNILGKWYYFRSGKMLTGWIQQDGYSGWYYLGQDGSMKTGLMSIEGKTYYLNDRGLLAQDTVIDGIYYDSDGVAQSKDKQKVLVDNEYVKITYLGVDRAGIVEKKIELQIENKSNQQLVIETNNVTVDGFKLQIGAGGIRETIVSGKTVLTSINYGNIFIKTNFDNIDGDFKIEEGNGINTITEEHFSIIF